MKKEFTPHLVAFSFAKDVKSGLRIGYKFKPPLVTRTGYVMNKRLIEGVETIFVCSDRKPNGITCKDCAERKNCPLYMRSTKKISSL